MVIGFSLLFLSNQKIKLINSKIYRLKNYEVKTNFSKLLVLCCILKLSVCLIVIR